MSRNSIRMFSEKWKRISFLFVIFSGIQFVVMTSIAMIFYSGEYIFFMNPFSSLGATEISGNPNTISFILFTITLSLFAISYPLFFLVILDFFKDNAKERRQIIYAIITAIISASGMIGVVFTPGNLYPNEHNFSAVILYLFAVFPYISYTRVIYQNNNYTNKYGMVSLIFVICLFTFIISYLIPPPYTTPEGALKSVILQKVVHYAWCTCLVIQGYWAWKLSK